MNYQTALLLVVAAFSSGCATINKMGQQPEAGTASTNSRSTGDPLAIGAATPKPRISPMSSSQPVSPNVATQSVEAPLAIIKVDPKTGKMTGEMELRLQKVIAEAKQDDRALLRIESFVPSGGSSGFDLGTSERTVQIVKDRLVGSGITQRRILVSSFGAEHDQQRYPTHHWVEIYLVRTGVSSTPALAGERN